MRTVDIVSVSWSNGLALAVKALRKERNRWVLHTNLEAGRYEAWRWADDLSQKTEILPLGNGPGGVEAASRFNIIVDERSVLAALEAIKNPNEIMIKAGGVGIFNYADAGFPNINGLSDGNSDLAEAEEIAEKAWRAMIGVLLADGNA